MKTDDGPSTSAELLICAGNHMFDYVLSCLEAWDRLTEGGIMGNHKHLPLHQLVWDCKNWKY